jgi:tRNA (guanine-N7-)-methyltransferase
MARGTGNYDNPPQPPEGEFDPREHVAGSGPLELVIGPGRGGFLLERAEFCPEQRLLGLEIKRKWACIVDERLGRHHAGRARAWWADAKECLPRMQPAGCIERVFIHFPDPWWKKRHLKRMVIVDPLVDEIVRLLRPNGELFIQTDVAERGQRYEEVVSSQSLLLPFGDEGAALKSNPYVGRSNRERRADEDGLPVYRYRWRRAPAAD